MKKDYGPYGNLAKSEWKRLRPKMYRALVKSGQLDSALEDAQKNTSDMIIDLVLKGMQVHEAKEVVMPMFVSPMSEDDQPNLGESSEPDQEIIE